MLNITLSGARTKSVVVGVAIFAVLLVGTIMPFTFGLQSISSIPNLGTISYSPVLTVTVNANKAILANTLSLGFQVDYPWEWKAFRDRPVQRQLVSEAGFKLVRIDDRHLGPLDYSKGVGPCSYWNEGTQTGSFSWTDVDSVVQAIFDTGAEPLICLSAWRDSDQKPTVPPGMLVDSATLLPYPDSYGAFTAAWVQHFKTVGLPVKYYEIFNEIQTYIGWNWYTRNETRTAYFVNLFNAAYTSMHSMNSQIIVSFDASTLKWVFPRLLSQGTGLDSLNFHKYDDWQKAPNAFSDQKMFQRAEDVYFQKEDDDTYTVDYVRNTWLAQRGKVLPVILSEGNWNAAYGPTDERVQQMAGALRTALLIRMEILKGVAFNVYYTLNSDGVWENSTYGGGRGFGMIDCDSRHSVTQSYDNPWYPYYVQKLFGANLSPNDSVVEATCDSADLRIIAWTHDTRLNIVLICKVTEARVVKLIGLSGQLQFLKLDDTYSFEEPHVQEGVMNAQDLIAMNGYTVMLLQT